MNSLVCMSFIFRIDCEEKNVLSSQFKLMRSKRSLENGIFPFLSFYVSVLTWGSIYGLP